MFLAWWSTSHPESDQNLLGDDHANKASWRCSLVDSESIPMGVEDVVHDIGHSVPIMGHDSARHNTTSIVGIRDLYHDICAIKAKNRKTRRMFLISFKKSLMVKTRPISMHTWAYENPIFHVFLEVFHERKSQYPVAKYVTCRVCVRYYASVLFVCIPRDAVSAIFKHSS